MEASTSFHTPPPIHPLTILILPISATITPDNGVAVMIHVTATMDAR